MAVDAHNALLLAAPPAPVPFAVLERAHILPHISVENTIVQVLVREPILPVDPLAIVGFLVQRLTEPASLWFGSRGDFPSKIRFDFDGEQTDILGFTDGIFRDSLRGFLRSRPPAIRAALAAPAKLRDNVLRDAGIATALLLFEDIGEADEPTQQLPLELRLATALSELVGLRARVGDTENIEWKLLKKPLKKSCELARPERLKALVKMRGFLWSPPILDAIQRLWP
jgi:hypothetical protein